MPMDINQQKEQFSNAYFQTIVAAAGYQASKPSVDDHSTDWTVSGYQELGLLFPPEIDVQLKSSANNRYLEENIIAFDLKTKNYNDLCAKQVLKPRILVLVILPEDPSLWTFQTQYFLGLRYCGYWLSLAGEAPISATQKRVYFDRKNVFSVEHLQHIMNTFGTTGRYP